MYSQKMTLIVGCTPDFVMTQDPLFSVATVSLMVNDPKTDIYTILPPTVSPTPPSYCPINLSIISLLKDGGVATGSEIGFAASCGASLPCLSLDLQDTLSEYTLTFKIRTTLGTSSYVSDSNTATV